MKTYKDAEIRFTLDDMGPPMTVTFNQGGISFTDIPAPRFDMREVRGSFSIDVDMGPTNALISAIGSPELWPSPGYDVVLTYRSRKPDPGALRRWARTISLTPWRSRSLASWRHLWRKVARDATVKIENVTISPGTGDVLMVETSGPTAVHRRI